MCGAGVLTLVGFIVVVVLVMRAINRGRRARAKLEAFKSDAIALGFAKVDERTGIVEWRE